MEAIPILGFIISGFAFLGCLDTALKHKRGWAFFGVTLITTFFLCVGLLVVLAMIFAGQRFGGVAVIVYGIFIGSYLPGVASIVGKMAVVPIGKPVTDENPYENP